MSIPNRHLRAIDLKARMTIIYKGLECEVTHTRKSKYDGFRDVQVRPCGDTDYARVVGHSIHITELVEVKSVAASAP